MNRQLHKGLRTWIEIDKKAVAHNYLAFRDYLDKNSLENKTIERVKILSVVKSNAYGHSLIEFAQEQVKLGADFLGVDSVIEAITLRKVGIKIPILVLGYTLPEMIDEAAKKNISITISNFESLKAVIEANVKIRIHIKIDTGMYRHGFMPDEILEVIKKLKNNNPSQTKSQFDGAGNIIVEGLYTHFSMAKDPIYPTQTKLQAEKFQKCRNAFLKVGFTPICHASATSGMLVFKDAYFDMVRIGIGLYGVWPSAETKLYFEKSFSLKPVLSWKTIIAETKKVNKDSRVGYDGTAVIKKDSVLAICPIGYWHGYPRALSNVGYVLVSGEKAKVVGRVCMDIIVIDITGIKNVKVGDEVVIIGKSRNPTSAIRREITADEISLLLGASTYELLTRINPLIKRFYI